MVTYILFILGFIILIKGASLLIDGSSSIAKRLHISDLAIGLTVVAFGTSAPELFVNLFAAYQGTSHIVIGNIIGSNIANILLILGITAIIYSLRVNKGVVWREIPFSLLSVGLVAIMANDIIFNNSPANVISRTDGFILLGLFGLFLYHMFTARMKYFDPSKNVNAPLGIKKSIGYMVIGILGLAFGGQWIVNGAIELATLFGLSQTFIGLTVIAIGTSLPELVTSIIAALKKNANIAVGNAVGSSIFNIFLVLGLTAVVLPLNVPIEINFDLGIVILANILLFIWMFIGKRHILDRKAGLTFVSIYIFYLFILVSRQ